MILKFTCEDKQDAAESCAQWYGDHIFKIFVDILDYKGKDKRMYQRTWTYVQIKMFCDGIQNYVSLNNINKKVSIYLN